jgi:hypothetical protein
MGRAFRVVKRTAHLTVRVAERPSKIVASADGGEEKRPRRAGAKPKAKAAGAAKKTTTAKAKRAANAADKKEAKA